MLERLREPHLLPLSDMVWAEPWAWCLSGLNPSSESGAQLI